LKSLLPEIKKCSLCTDLPLGPAPLLSVSPYSKIVIVGQAPGLKAHTSGIPWNDASGNRLRKWLGVTEEEFYNPNLFALIPMAFCYPGKGKNGDLPPPKICASTWHRSLLDKIKQPELTVLVGNYAQRYYLVNNKFNLTDTVKSFQGFLPAYFPIVHPSPNSRFWLSKNPWFEQEVVQVLEQIVGDILGGKQQAAFLPTK
jgi:uracil-DNA glycosylase family 4